MKEQCTICGGRSFALVSEGLRDGTTEQKVYKCESCSYVQLLPRPSAEEDQAFYDRNGQDRAVRAQINLDWEREAFAVDVARRADTVDAVMAAEGSLLDVGTGYGFFLEAMRERGYSVRGIEIGEERRKMAREITNAPIDATNLITEDPLADQVSDVVTLFHVLEHVADPVGFARALKALVKPGGALVCEAPNVDELLLETCTDYRRFYWIRAHLSYFSKTILERVLLEAGFREVSVSFVQRYGLENLSHWLTFGKPQIQRPLFKIDAEYGWLEDQYRDRLAQTGRTDTLVAVARA
jgi:2-polyprenyl-3-methyl-5-hydroxy-6-metoxy-1,4-benzoquinol methylase